MNQYGFQIEIDIALIVLPSSLLSLQAYQTFNFQVCFITFQQILRITQSPRQGKRRDFGHTFSSCSSVLLARHLPCAWLLVSTRAEPHLSFRYRITLIFSFSTCVLDSAHDRHKTLRVDLNIPLFEGSTYASQGYRYPDHDHRLNPDQCILTSNFEQAIGNSHRVISALLSKSAYSFPELSKLTFRDQLGT